MAGSGATYSEVPIEAVAPNPRNVRKELGDLASLVESVQTLGILQPLVVRPVTGEERADYPEGIRWVIVMGHRRHAAAIEAGAERVPVVVRTDAAVSVESEAAAMVVENLQRSDLNPIEEAAAYQLLVDGGMSQREIARQVGFRQAHISRRLALLALSPAAQLAVIDGQLQSTVAGELGKQLPDPSAQADVIERLTTRWGQEEAWDAAEVERTIGDVQRDRRQFRLQAAADQAGAAYVNARDAQQLQLIEVTDSAQRAELAERGELLAYVTPGQARAGQDEVAPEEELKYGRQPSKKERTAARDEVEKRRDPEAEQRAEWQRTRDGVAAWLFANQKPPRMRELTRRLAEQTVRVMTDEVAQVVYKWQHDQSKSADLAAYHAWREKVVELPDAELFRLAWWVTVATDMYALRYSTTSGTAPAERTRSRIEEAAQ